MIIAFIGTVGGGKTLSMTYEAFKYHNMCTVCQHHALKHRDEERCGVVGCDCPHLIRFQVYSNYHLAFPHTKLTKKVFDEIIQSPQGLTNAIVCLDEVHIWIDSRSGMQKKNKTITYFILQTRKRNVRLLVSTQHLHQIDKRLRDTIDILVFCRNMTNKTSTIQDNKKKVYIGQEYLFQWKESPPKNKMLFANPVFALFNTEEIIDVTESS